MGMVFQSFGLFPHLTASQQITLPLEKVHGWSHDAAQERAEDLLGTLGLKDKSEAYPSQLSGGQKQRVGIARALGPSPDLMLFDEPTSALDPELVGEVIDAISALAKQGMTMIVVTHEMQMAREIADRIVFFDGGKMIFNATPDEAFAPEAPERMKRFLQRFIGSGI
jgi:polar amino acid transport system ATP-binding protein